MSNFAYVMTVPSWVNEKAPGVSINRSVWFSSVVVFLCYAVLGVAAAAAFGNLITKHSDFLTVLALRAQSNS